MIRPRTLRLLLACVPALSACSILDKPVVGVDHVGSRRVDVELNENALTGSEPSASALETLHYFGLADRWEDAPDEALVALHRAVAAEPERAFLHALSELQYLRARELEDRDRYLAAAVYAWLYLLGEPELEPASPYDRRFRWACDLYNRSLREAFLSDDGEEMNLVGGVRKLPVGELAVTVDRSMFPYAEPDIRFLPADDYSVWGLSVRLRDSGLGAPLVGRSESADPADPLAPFLPRKLTVPATIFLRCSGSLADLEKGARATLELHSSLEPREVMVDDRRVPLESDFTTALAFALDRSTIWGFSTRGFFRGDETERETRIVCVRPPRRGLVPVVFVHGTVSSPGYWAEMFNLLLAEPAIREHMQFWFFQYGSGNPIPFSAAVLREQIGTLVHRLDPDGTDPTLRRMIVIGHSQGGLIAKLTAVDSDMSWWNEIAGVPLESLDLPADQEELLRSAIDFDPVPQVERVVFLATPHRGSYRTKGTLSQVMAKMIALPGKLAGVNDSLQRNADKLPDRVRAGLPTSLDNMQESNPFLQLLLRAPIAPGVEAHSIIAIGDADPAHPEDADDGIVTYKSAHLDGVASELLVPTGHSCQSDPHTIAEVRRILLLHLEENAGTAARPRGQ